MPYLDKDKEREAKRRYAAKKALMLRTDAFGDRPCVVCGGRDRLRLVKTGTSFMQSSGMFTGGYEQFRARVKDTEVICVMCRRLRRFDEIPHGKMNKYYYYGCRCDVCRNAASTSANKYKKARRAVHKKRVQQDFMKSDKPTHRIMAPAKKVVKPIQHGTIAGYRAPCRCEACKTTWSVYTTAWRRRNEYRKKMLYNLEYLNELPDGKE